MVENQVSDDTGLDYAALFDAAPAAYFVLSPDFVILAVNRASARVTGRAREELVGRPVFEAFPDNPNDPAGDGVSNLRTSLDRVLRSRLPDTLPLQKYDIPDGRGGFVERYWSAVNIPVLKDGQVRWVLHRTEDVTDLVAGSAPGLAREDEEAWRERVRVVEADLLARAQELRAAQLAEARTARRLAALADVALALSTAHTPEDLTTAVIEVGLRALGADGGAVAVRDNAARTVRLAFASLSERTRQQYQELPLSGPLPASISARTGQRVLLRDRKAGLELTSAMAEVHASTGLEAWAALPLRSGGRLLGALTVGWREPQEFADDDVDLFAAFAAQCAQALDRVQRLTSERQQADLARHMAETLQRSLLTAPPEPNHLHVVVKYLPAAQEAQVGGDWFDAFRTPDGSTNVVIGDVTGHDTHAVAAMGQMRNMLRGVAYTLVQPPAAVLSALDRALRGMAVDALATVVLAQIQQTSEDAAHGLRRFRWSNAGHLPPLLLLPNGTAELLRRAPDLLLGVKADSPRADNEVLLPAGATVVLYTDGLVERRGEHLEAGLERLRTIALRLAHLPLDAFCEALLEQLSPVRDDDIALAAVRVHPLDEPRPPEAGPRALPPELP